jgi:hypothetical protein
MGTLIRILIASVVGVAGAYGIEWYFHASAPEAIVAGILLVILGILIESISLLLKNSAGIISEIRGDNEILNAMSAIRQLEYIPGIKDRFEHLKNAINDLADGDYKLNHASEVYDEDVKLLKHLRDGEEFKATLPIQGDPTKYLANPAFQKYITALIESAMEPRQLKITRIYIFDEKAQMEQEIVQDHFKHMINGRIKVMTICKDSLSREVGDQLNALDFVIFGKKRVSITATNNSDSIITFRADYTSKKTTVANIHKKWGKLCNLAEKVTIQEETVICPENQWRVNSYDSAQWIECTPVVTCKILMVHSDLPPILGPPGVWGFPGNRYYRSPRA